MATPAAIGAGLDDLIRDLAAHLGQALPRSVSIILHGSAAMGGFSPRYSDLDLIVVLSRSIDALARPTWITHLDRVLRPFATWRSRLDLKLVPMPALLRPLDHGFGGLALRHGQWAPTAGYALSPLETLGLHLQHRVLHGSAIVPFFPPAPPHTPVDDALATLREIRAGAWRQLPFQLRRAGDPSADLPMAVWALRLARLAYTLAHGRPAPAPTMLRHVGDSPTAKDDGAWWHQLADAWTSTQRRTHSSAAAGFPRQYIVFLKHLLSLAGRGRPALANLWPTPDRSGAISYHLIHQRFQMKLCLDVLFHEFVPGSGLKPRRPMPDSTLPPALPNRAKARPSKKISENPRNDKRWPW